MTTCRPFIREQLGQGESRALRMQLVACLGVALNGSLQVFARLRVPSEVAGEQAEVVRDAAEREREVVHRKHFCIRLEVSIQRTRVRLFIECDRRQPEHGHYVQEVRVASHCDAAVSCERMEALTRRIQITVLD